MKIISVKSISLIFILGMTAFSCKDDDDSSSNPKATPINEQRTEFFLGSFSADLDETNFKMVATSTNNVGIGIGAIGETNTSVSPFVTKITYNSSLSSSLSGERAGILVGSITYSGSNLPSKSEFLALFSTGSKNYDQNLNDGVEVYVVIDQVTWSSSYGTADQSGSTFNIISAKESEDFMNYYFEIEASFSCTLYDDSGNSKLLTNGKFKGLFQNS